MEDENYGDINGENYRLAHINNRMEKILSSLSYRLGNLIVDSIRKPWKMLLLPMNIILLFYSYSIERLGRKRVNYSNSRALSYPPRNCVILFPTNGVGMGHMSRMIALAKSLQSKKPSLEIVFFTTNYVIHHLYQNGFTCYHLPGRKKFSQMTPSQWNSICEDKLSDVISLHRPSVFVFDGSYPYRGMLNAIKGREEIHKVWVRRSGRKDLFELPNDSLAHFDRLVIPDDYLELELEPKKATEMGVDQINFAPPMISVSRNDLLPRGSLRGRLGIPKDALVCLVSLGAGVVNEIKDVRNFVVDSLTSREIYVIIADSMLNPTKVINGNKFLRYIKEYPLMHFRNCFDFSIISGGYNSIHEAVHLRLPSLILPNENTGSDDQLTRAIRASENGGFIVIEQEDYDLLELGIERICDADVRKQMIQSMQTKDKSIDGSPYIAEALLFPLD